MTPTERRKLTRRLPLRVYMTRLIIEIGSATDRELLLWGLGTAWPFCAIARLEIMRRGRPVMNIITPKLVRHYLVATGWNEVRGGWSRHDRSVQNSDDLETWLSRIQRCLGGHADLRAVLGMLAAAEDQYTEARELLKRSDDLGPWAAGRMSAIADAWCWKADVEPKAWEKAREP